MTKYNPWAEILIFNLSSVLKGKKFQQKKGICRLNQGFKIGLNKNGSKFKKTEELCLLVISTLILQLTYIPLCYFSYLFKGGYKCTLRSSESTENWMGCQ